MAAALRAPARTDRAARARGAPGDGIMGTAMPAARANLEQAALAADDLNPVGQDGLGSEGLARLGRAVFGEAPHDEPALNADPPDPTGPRWADMSLDQQAAQFDRFKPETVVAALFGRPAFSPLLDAVLRRRPEIQPWVTARSLEETSADVIVDALWGTSSDDLLGFLSERRPDVARVLAERTLKMQAPPAPARRKRAPQHEQAPLPPMPDFAYALILNAAQYDVAQLVYALYMGDRIAPALIPVIKYLKETKPDFAQAALAREREIANAPARQKLRAGSRSGPRN
ncbi:MAG: hypothetical protein HY552_06800 [Elusimicrobia bacterium]|nr:hypothetical protein [Elusimicrobiota bacterium]